jgi:antitoxin component of RelBE/YafQ-DinJ toxin-antitoxin module
MQTTLRIDDQLYREAKAAAAQEGVTLTQFLHEGLRLRLRKEGSAPIRFRTYQAGAPMILNDAQLKDAANQAQEIHDLKKLAR